MSATTPHQPEQPLQRSQTADSSLSRRRKKSADRRQATPRESFVPQTRPTSLYRHNKLYRGPPTPPPEVQYDRERSFILDAKAVSNISNDYSVANPKLGSVIPPYNAQLDSHVDNYFKFFSHSVEEIRGHELFLSDPKPIVNYNGLFGYRRNTPSLRHQPTIGTKKINTYNYTPLGRYSIIGCGKTYTFHCRCKFDQPCRCYNQDKLCPCVKA
ncbi:unnamed protein product [Rotaria magnacalcarata]|uniref:Uncharacterized protein n=1 Tax=Rotaria magnacalcarata TaxID=392030 RepID=A0A8S2NJG1_9BILA|nr:unnamed protein product [Rotaria magnacalcarata]